MAAEFLLPRSEGRPLTVRLERDAVVGRGADAGLRISSRRVSRSHCRLTVDGSVVRVRDLGSRNGTFVNGEGVGDRELDVPLGGTLSIGGVTMKLVRAGDRSYRPDGAAMLAEVESHVAEGGLSEDDLQDSPSGTLVGQEPPEELSDDSVLVTDSGTNLEAVGDDEARDKPDLPSPTSPAKAAVPVAEPDPVVVADPTDEAPTDEAPTDEAPTDADDAETVETLRFDPGDPNGENGTPGSGGDGSETIADEDAAFDFLNDGEEEADADSSALKALPGADAQDQSSFAGFGDADDEEDVDSSLLGFLNDTK
ncbi:FHA domain-containing protein [Alienimonas sp. DA493]|uniref:FHA domain-containing protein n=1 Tax=Alienimonas sp. DA493 TaxID=3373605 RepID=UPI0037544E47